MRRLKILLVTPRFPFPSLSGGEKWAAGLATALSASHDVSLFAFSVPGAETHQTALAMSLEGRLFSKVYMPPKPPGGEDPSLPALPRSYWSREAAEALSRAAAETGAEVVHILFSEMACYQSALPAGLPAVYTEIDSSYLFPWKYYLRETAGLKGFLKLGELLRSRAYARRHYRRFAGATFITASDGRDISPYLSARHTAVTPNAVAPADFAQASPAPRRDGEILFLGHYPHFPNEDAALRLARRIFPSVRAECPAATLTLAGSCPTPKVQALAGAAVEVTGTLPDIRPLLWRASVFAAPVRYGLGTKGKILEAFAAGLPVVASREAAAGVEEARDGIHLLAASSESDFIRSTSLLLRDAALRQRLSSAALELVREKYDINAAARTVSSIYGKVADAS